MILVQSATRVLAFVRTELVQVLRRPAALLSLILGPFAIMVVFGLGYQGIRPTVRAIVVVPPSSGLPTDIHTYERPINGIDVVAVMSDAAPAEAQLRQHNVDAVIVYPADLKTRFQDGKQSTIKVEVSLANPSDVVIAGGWAQQLATWTNQTMIATAVAGGEQAAPSSIKKIPPDVVAAPTKAELDNLSPAGSGVVPYFGPSVLILILQHLCVTLVALSLLLERKSGIFEIYRIGPTNAWEIILGKLIAYMIIGAAIAAASMALLVGPLNVPILGSLSDVGWTLGLVLFASIGVGLLLGVIADSERTAVQASLLILLASIFFSGFIIDLTLFVRPVQYLAVIIPATHGITALHGALLFGSIGDPAPLAALGAIAAISVVASWLLLRRTMAAVG